MNQPRPAQYGNSCHSLSPTLKAGLCNGRHNLSEKGEVNIMKRGLFLLMIVLAIIVVSISSLRSRPGFNRQRHNRRTTKHSWLARIKGAYATVYFRS